MHTIALVLVGLVCEGHGRHVIASSGHAQNSAEASERSFTEVALSRHQVAQASANSGLSAMRTLAMFFRQYHPAAGFNPAGHFLSGTTHCAGAHSVALHGRSSTADMILEQFNLPRDLKDMTSKIRDATQSSLSSRQSRLSVDMPLGFTYGILGEDKYTKKKKMGGAKVLQADDVMRSNRELARLFLGFFEDTGLKPFVFFPSEDQRAAAMDVWWDIDDEDAVVKTLLPAQVDPAPAPAPKPKKKVPAKATGGGGFGAVVDAGKAKKRGGRIVNEVLPSAEVVIAVAPGDDQLDLLREHCDRSGMDKLVILLNPRIDAAGGAEGDRKRGQNVEFFRDGGEGGFVTTFLFDTQPFGVPKAASADAEADKNRDLLVLYRKFPDKWIFARKPKVGPAKVLLERASSKGKPSVEELKEAFEKSGDDKGFLGLF